jgi:transposase
MVFRVRELLIRQRTQAINALRGHLPEFGLVVPQGAANAARLIALVEDPDSGLPAEGMATLKVLVTTPWPPRGGDRQARCRDRTAGKENEVARRLMTVPGIGPLIAQPSRSWLPRPRRSAARGLCGLAGPHAPTAFDRGKQRLGATTKMGERSLRRL